MLVNNEMRWKKRPGILVSLKVLRVLGHKWAGGLKTQGVGLLETSRLPVSQLPFRRNFCDIFMLSCKPVEIMTPLAKLLNKYDASNAKFIHDGST